MCAIGRYRWCSWEIACVSFAHIELLAFVGDTFVDRETEHRIGSKPSTLTPQHARPGQVHLSDRPVVAKGPCPFLSQRLVLEKASIGPARKTGQAPPARGQMFRLVFDPE